MIKFGTGGWRAIIGDDFTRSNIELVCAGLAHKMAGEGTCGEGVVIGYDRRFLSDTAARWCAEVFAAYGIPSAFIYQDAPTPMIMFMVKERNAPYGLAVTASHNPAEYNGIKIFTRGGRDASRETTDEIENHIAQIAGGPVKRMDFDAGVRAGLIKPVSPFNRYIDSILSLLDVECIRKKGPRILLDPMFGVSKTSLQTILLTCRCSVDVIHDRHDTLFGGKLPSPSAKTLRHLQNAVVEEHYDLGIATDGDADRLGVIDDKGNFIHPNDILVLLYYYLHEYKGWRGPVVRNIATTHLLDRMAESFGETCYEVPVGFKWISAKMDQTGAVIGGESSGGLTVKGHIFGKDGIFAGSLLVEMICRMGKGLREILDEIKEKYGRCEMSELAFRFTGEKKRQIDKILFADQLIPEFPVKIRRISYLDGLKVYFENGGWIICRFSGTEPLIRIFCEMPTMEEAEAVSRRMTDFLGLT